MSSLRISSAGHCSHGLSSEGHEKLLLDKNADIESKDKYDRTPLSQAAEVFICRIVRMPQAKDVSDF
jgi:hypothetical protein